jgi:hypothetical protein
MKKILVSARSPVDWQSLLRDPAKQWRDGYSAKELAKCSINVDGFPFHVQVALDAGPW